ncbi:hypothetical protein ILUMI_14798, partial [Ignelater luminosus]
TKNATQVENSTPEEEIQSKVQKPERRVTFQLPPVLVPAEQTPIAPGPTTSELGNDPVTPAFNGNYPEPTQTQPPEEVEVRRSQRTRRPVQRLNL